MKVIMLGVSWVFALLYALMCLPIIVAMCARAEGMSDDTGGIRALRLLITLALMILSIVPLALMCGAVVFALRSLTR